MLTGYCKEHDRYYEADEACSSCQDEIVAAHPEMGPSIRRVRFWGRAQVAWGVFVAVTGTIAWYVFMTYREYVIWSR